MLCMILGEKIVLSTGQFAETWLSMPMTKHFLMKRCAQCTDYALVVKLLEFDYLQTGSQIV